MRLRILPHNKAPACRFASRRLSRSVAGRVACVGALLFLFWQNAGAQLLPPDDFFHGGAQFYLSNNVPAALERVTNGLAIYPNDARLKKLEELLKQQNQQQQQNQDQKQNQQQNEQSKEDQQKKQDQQQTQNQNQSEKEKQEEQQKKEAQEKKDDKKPEPQQAKKSDDEQKDQNPEDQGQAQVAGQMTPEEAKKLLDAQKNDEMLMPVAKNERVADQKKPIKDW
jgi:outer membrane biosynthesis protein TonB